MSIDFRTALDEMNAELYSSDNFGTDDITYISPEGVESEISGCAFREEPAEKFEDENGEELMATATLVVTLSALSAAGLAALERRGKVEFRNQRWKVEVASVVADGIQRLKLDRVTIVNRTRPKYRERI